MPKLSPQHQLFVIQQLACYYQPSEVRALLKRDFGVDVSKQAIAYYDPTTAEGRRLSPSLKQIFDDTRERFLKEVTAIPIANQAYRLRKLQDLIDRAGDRNPRLVLAVLEQAAKEMGGLFTNRRDFTNAGAPFKVYLFDPAGESGELAAGE